MAVRPIRVLLIDDNPGDTRLIREFLRDEAGDSIKVASADRLSAGLAALGSESVDVILLDLLLPDSRGLATVNAVLEAEAEAPIIVLTGQDDEATGVAAVQAGAQDYLTKGQVDGSMLVRSIRFAIERHRAQSRLQSMSLLDELTHLYNRRGFLTLARQQLAVAERSGIRAILLFADVDNLKEINDCSGHGGGDAAIVATAAILRETFRKADVLGRMGGDEFAVLALETSGGTPESLSLRLAQTLRRHNRRRPKELPVSISTGMVVFSPGQPATIEDLLAKADGLMYEEKRTKKALQAHGAGDPAPSDGPE